jgi:PAS domain S-box-containing protein/putative nucleotidyltransferase with HDIG domain
MTGFSPAADPGEIAALRQQVAELEDALEAIRRGAVDAVVTAPGVGGAQLYSTTTADRPYRLIVEAMGEGAATVSPGGRILYANQQLAALLQCERETLIGRVIGDLVSAGQQPQLATLEALGPGQRAQATLELVRGDGSGVTVLASLSALVIEEVGGEVIRCLITTDLTQIRLAQQAMEDSELSFRMLALNAQDGILILNWSSGRITLANPYISRLLGCQPQELLGKELWEIGSLLDKVMALQLFAELQETGYVRYENMPLRSADGSLKEVEFVSNAYLVGEQRVIQCNIRDISERRAAERLAKAYQEETLRSLQDMVAALVALSEARDPYTAGHQARVAQLATAIAAEMGLSEHQIEGIRISGLVHDIGKFAIPAELLVKPTSLKPEEMALIRTHVQEGADVLLPIHFPWPVAEAVLQHHERLDGSGYPRGLVGEAIGLEGRILGVADTVEAMATHRPYRFSKGLEAALDVIEAGKGKIYDPAVADACLRLFREKGYQLPNPSERRELSAPVASLATVAPQPDPHG